MDPRIAKYTANQLGLISRAQLRDLGLSRSAINHLVESGRLRAITPRVLLLSGSPITAKVRALGATLDAGGVLSHRSAAAHWGAPGYHLLPPHVTRIRGGRVVSSHYGVVHEPRQLLDQHITTYQCIPVLSPSRLMFDLAATEHPLRVERTLDWFWSRRLVTVASLTRMLDEVGGRGRRGVRTMRALIADRESLAAPGSNLEVRFHELVRRARLPEFVRQVDLGDDDGWIGRVDFTSTTRLLVVEIDSEICHAALSYQRDDNARRARLGAMGFMVRKVDEGHLFHESHRVVAQLRRWHATAPVR